MELSHDLRYITFTIINQEILVKNTVLLVVIELESASLFAAKNRSESLVDQALCPDRQILLQIVIKRDAMIDRFEKFDLTLQIGTLKLLLDSHEVLVVSFLELQTCGVLL